MTNQSIFLLTFVLFFLRTGNLYSQQTDAANTEQWALTTVGGQGGKILRVTNLNTSGPGSFSEAVSAKGARIVVFEVGGILDLKQQSIKIKEPFLTIAGQTAPSPGVTMINGDMSVATHDVIVQHIRIRTGASLIKEGEPDAFASLAAHDVIIDHCSFSWAVDENCSVSGPRFEGNSLEEWRKNTSHRVSITNCIISEGLSNSTHSKGEHSKGTLVHDNATDILIYRNLYASNKDRNVLYKGGASSVYANNYIHNPGMQAIHYALVKSQWKGHKLEEGKLSIVGNVLQYGPDTEAIPLLQMYPESVSRTYMEDNIAIDLEGNPVPQIAGDHTELENNKPIWYKGLEILKASELKKSIIKSVGARPWDRDDVDKRIIKEMETLKGKIIDSELEVGGYPEQKMTRGKFKVKDWDLSNMTKKTGK